MMNLMLMLMLPIVLGRANFSEVLISLNQPSETRGETKSYVLRAYRYFFFGQIPIS